MYELIMNEKEQKHLRAELIFAKKLELIEDDTLNGVEDRRQKENHKREEMLQKGEIVYGAEHFSLPAYVRYEQTRFCLDFVSESEKVKKNYTYRERNRHFMKQTETCLQDITETASHMKKLP